MMQSDTPSKEAFRVIGYQTDYSGSVSEIEFEHLTHVNYAFLLPADNGDGSLQPLRSPEQLHELVRVARTNEVKVLISVGGWNDGNDQGFEILAGSEQSTARFVNNMIDFVQEFQLDGIDIDWEYPGPDAQSAKNYANLMKLLHIAMRERGLLLTTAVVALGATGAGVLEEVFDYIDFLNIMAYDGSGENGHSPFSYAEESMDYWLQRGVPANKAVLGVPFYGRPSWAPYRVLVKENPDAANKDEVLRDGKPVYYNGRPTIQAKTELALQKGSGIMMWELSEDTHDSNSLLRTMSETIKNHQR